MHLIAIGRLRGGPEAALFERYNSRLRPPLRIVELPEERGTPLVVKRREAAAILGVLPKDAFVVPLDSAGEALDSHALAGRMLRWSEVSRTLCFIIGGAEGLDAAVIARADTILSLGAMTWPHFLVRAMLAEQLYRAQAINQGHPYHKATRPEG